MEWIYIIDALVRKIQDKSKIDEIKFFNLNENDIE